MKTHMVQAIFVHIDLITPQPSPPSLLGLLHNVSLRGLALRIHPLLPPPSTPSSIVHSLHHVRLPGHGGVYAYVYKIKWSVTTWPHGGETYTLLDQSCMYLFIKVMALCTNQQILK